MTKSYKAGLLALYDKVIQGIAIVRRLLRTEELGAKSPAVQPKKKIAPPKNRARSRPLHSFAMHGFW
jgi:hypothetical protein